MTPGEARAGLGKGRGLPGARAEGRPDALDAPEGARLRVSSVLSSCTLALQSPQESFLHPPDQGRAGVGLPCRTTSQFSRIPPHLRVRILRAIAQRNRASRQGPRATHLPTAADEERMWCLESQAVPQQAMSHCLKGRKGKAIPESGHGWQREATSVRGAFYKPFLNKGCTCFSKEVPFFTPTFCDRGSPSGRGGSEGSATVQKTPTLPEYTGDTVREVAVGGFLRAKTPPRLTDTVNGLLGVVDG